MVHGPLPPPTDPFGKVGGNTPPNNQGTKHIEGQSIVGKKNTNQQPVNRPKNTSILSRKPEARTAANKMKSSAPQSAPLNRAKKLIEKDRLSSAQNTLSKLEQALKNKNSDFKMPDDVIVKMKLEDGTEVKLVPLDKKISSLSKDEKKKLLNQIKEAMSVINSSLEKDSGSLSGISQQLSQLKLEWIEQKKKEKEENGQPFTEKMAIDAWNKELGNIYSEATTIKNIEVKKKNNDEDELINTMENVDLAQSAVGAAGSVAKGLLDKN